MFTKKFIPALVAMFFICSCSVPRGTYVEEYAIIDYTSIMDKYGVFLTEANSVSFEYSPVGSVYAKIISGRVQEETTFEVRDKDDVYARNMTVRKVEKGEIVEASPEKAIELAVKKAVSNGANGIIGLSIETISVGGEYGVVVTGMAIRK